MTVDIEKPINIPQVWGRVCAVVIERNCIAAVWAAFNRVSDTFYVIDEYKVALGQLALHAEAIRKRGRWIPALFEAPEGLKGSEHLHIAQALADLGVEVFTVPLNEEAGAESVNVRLATERLKVFQPMPKWLAEYRSYRRDTEGELDQTEPHPLMRATALLALHGADVAISEAEAMNPPVEEDYGLEKSRAGY